MLDQMTKFFISGFYFSNITLNGLLTGSGVNYRSGLS